MGAGAGDAPGASGLIKGGGGDFLPPLQAGIQNNGAFLGTALLRAYHADCEVLSADDALPFLRDHCPGGKEASATTVGVWTVFSLFRGEFLSAGEAFLHGFSDG